MISLATPPAKLLLTRVGAQANGMSLSAAIGVPDASTARSARFRLD